MIKVENGVCEIKTSEGVPGMMTDLSIAGAGRKDDRKERLSGSSRGIHREESRKTNTGGGIR